MKHLYIPVIMMLAAMQPVAGQNYTKDVDVTVELNPEVRAASRLDISPVLKLKKYDVASLPYSGSAVATQVTPMITPLDAPGPRANYETPETRGYMSAGYFYSEDFGVTAGYRLVENRMTRVDVWTQLNHGTTSGELLWVYGRPEGDKMTLATTNWSIGANLATVTGAGLLKADASYFLSRFNYPTGMTDPAKQNVHRFKMDASWNGTSLKSDGFTYGISAGMERFGYAHGVLPAGFTSDGGPMKSLAETSAHVDASASYRLSDVFGLGIDVGYSMANTTGQSDFVPGTNEYSSRGKLSRGVLKTGISLSFDSGHFDGNVAGTAYFNTGDSNGTFIGASGNVKWSPSQYFGLFADVTSGTIVRTLGDMFETSRYAIPRTGAALSRVDGDLTVGMKIGLLKGFSFTATGGLCSCSNWLMPLIVDKIPTFSIGDLMSVYYGFRLEYSTGRLISAYATYEGALSDEPTHAYYKWSDRASRVAAVGVQCHPVEPLTLGVEYEFRGGRKVCEIEHTESVDGVLYPSTYLIGIGRLNHANITVNYNFNSYISAYARVTGLGQRKYHTIAGTPGSRLAGLVGVTFRF